MRKINKDYSDIPISLIPAYADLFHGGSIHASARNTHTARLEIINNGSYIDRDKYNNCYKYKDIKDKLSSLYHNKCAFCEQRIEQYHVEHYRPKNGNGAYYWLAFSWDNLLLACPKCNTSKGSDFQLSGIKAIFNNTERGLKNINTLSSDYDIIEQPKMVNPEVTDPSGFILFHRDGSVQSNNIRFSYTIDKCKLDRAYLKDERRKIFDEFEKKLKSKILKFAHDQNLIKSHISELISEYISEAENLDNEYIAFRKYSIQNGWLNTALKSLLAH
ncbi:HNH endonuclease [Dysgonomonas sp.]